ncbi:MAG: replication factor C large subunit [Promethearchaeota archaeon]|nr:MAG: replication factor C large subunit [Candidatus Lokiarchaeota archaeon]
MKKKPDLPWIEKYRPTSEKEIKGFTTNIKKIKEFLANFESKQKSGKQLKSPEKAILLEGPPGIGKTTVVYALANDLGYSVIEMNASDVRTEKAIVETLQESISTTDLMSFINPKKEHRKKIILIDEVDGISGQSDRGGLKAIISLIKISKNPIIMTCNFYSTKFRGLYDASTKIQCRSLRSVTIVNLLREIATKEKLTVNDTVLEAIAGNSGGDMRSAINDLQALAMGVFSDVEFLDLHRDIQEKIFTFLQAMFDQKTIKNAKDILSNIDFDYKILHQIIHANLPGLVTQTKDLHQVIMNLVDADTLMSRIMTRMDFSLLPYYFDLVSGGVILSVEKHTSDSSGRFKMPNLSSLQFRYASDATLEELQKYFYKSKPEIARTILPQIGEIICLYNDSEKTEKLDILAEEFGITSLELKKYLQDFQN